MIILDTNVVSEPLRPNPSVEVVHWLNGQTIGTLYLTAISLSELLVGVDLLPAGKRRNSLASDLHGLLANVIADRFLAFDTAAAESHALLVAKARKQGRPIAIVDSLIAGIAKSHGFAVATRDVEPFRAAGVDVINPWEA